MALEIDREKSSGRLLEKIVECSVDDRVIRRGNSAYR